MSLSVGRRPLIAGLVLGAAAAALPAPARAATDEPPPRLPLAEARRIKRVRPGSLSSNGWPIETAIDCGGAIWTTPVTGSPAAVALRIGEPAVVLLHVLRRFNYEVQRFEGAGPLAWRPAQVRQAGPESNYLSGTAVEALPSFFPAGVRGGLQPQQRAVVESIVRECRGVVAWGGTFRVARESHFHIARPPGDHDLAALADDLMSTQYV